MQRRFIGRNFQRYFTCHSRNAQKTYKSNSHFFLTFSAPTPTPPPKPEAHPTSTATAANPRASVRVGSVNFLKVKREVTSTLFTFPGIGI
jgi:hypothetical protein